MCVCAQEVTGAPGEVIEFKVRAVDQSNNWRRAVWSLHDKGVTTVHTARVFKPKVIHVRTSKQLLHYRHSYVL